MFSNSASAQSMAQMKYANSGSAGGHLGSGMTGFASSFSATKQIEGECYVRVMMLLTNTRNFCSRYMCE